MAIELDRGDVSEGAAGLSVTPLLVLLALISELGFEVGEDRVVVSLVSVQLFNDHFFI